MSTGQVVTSGKGATQAFPWGGIQWLMGKAASIEAAQTFGIVFIGPNQANLRHYHPNCEELLYVLSGSCDHTLGEETFRLGPGDLIRVPQGVVHHAINAGWEPLRAVISFSSGDRQTVFLE